MHLSSSSFNRFPRFGELDLFKKLPGCLTPTQLLLAVRTVGMAVEKVAVGAALDDNSVANESVLNLADRGRTT